ncbi:uncharacterized protein CANTADRAFT_58354 [Suhomyces tanzawaensis NRRL Y-17324]|uniref:Trafficking protein particle complex subunit 11 domain-containing protein n=1 Tax=Suhomyces tanzawaensis NRRL Y-17324 TaxID=984487 RepID=A0A1E4SPI0_9ASCO|nr:uncharacterized protein CANTADRAFT_58354 [Suhomyces tanzawaensis NRRL Y-17324]ODV81429.1 hypothetical protein CANTADRAFT_58354 [Suhomyces tanzawaensis NRRL Y-17324]
MELEELNLRNPIHIGYYDPFSIYPLIKEDFEAKLPLTNLHWKYSATKPVKSIPLLPVKLIEEVPKSTPGSSGTAPSISSAATASNAQLISSYQNHPIYTRLMLIKFESIDTYRSQVRPLIKEWLKNLVFKSNLEWMIVLFIPLSSKDKQSTFIKTSSYDKLKIDFGIDGKELKSVGFEDWWTNEFNDVERCFKLKESDSNISKLETYNEMISLMKTLLLTSFDNKYQYFNSQLPASASSDDFNKFITKLKYADLFNDMRIFQDSLNIYNELYKDLEKLNSKDPSQFSTSETFKDKESSKIKFESAQRIAWLKSSLLHDNKINLFSMKCLIFINQSILLQSLANFANTISISAIYISNLYQKLIYFLNDLSNTFTNQDLDEFTIFTIDNYLDLPICKKLTEINNKNNENNTTPYQLNEILEFQGELKLFKRSKLVKISKKCGYKLNGFNEILEGLPNLEEVSLNESTKETRSPDSVYKALKYPPLIEALKTEDSFFSAFEGLTEDVIQRFVSCNRSKTIDILSIDLALLCYQKGKYQESLDILQNSHDFFILNGWNFMGGVLLEVYLDCIEKLASKDHDLILLTSLKLFSSLINNNTTQNCGINNYKLIKKNEQIQKLYNKVAVHSLRLKQVMKYPVDQVFTVNVLPWIEADESNELDRYYINLEVTNLFGIDFRFEEIEVLLGSSGSTIAFSMKDVQITKEKHHKLKLITNDFKMGEFSPVKVTIIINDKVHLVKHYDDDNVSEVEETGNDTVIQEDSNARAYNPNGKLINTFSPVTGGLESISFYPNIDKLHCSIENAQSIQLGSTELNLTIINGSTDVQDVKLQFSSETKGLKLGNEHEEIKYIEMKGTSRIPIHYTYFSDNKVINVGVRISYTSNGEHFTYVVNEEIDITLKISVSVQDIFKSNYIYSKFQIGTSNPKSPIRILSNELTSENKNFKIEKPALPLTSSLVTFGEQPASIFYKVVPKDGYCIQQSDSLSLKIDYSILEDECCKHVEDLITEELRNSGLLRLWFLLKAAVVKHMQFDLNNYAINSFIRVTNAQEVKLQAQRVTEKYIRGKEDQSNLCTLLDKVLGGQKIEITSSNVGLQRHTLLITVPISSLKYLQLLEFEYEKEVKYLVGEPIEVNLNIETITKWFIDEEEDFSSLAQSSPKLGGKASEKKAESSLVRFQLTLQNDDNWLISGFKKHTFSIEDYKKSTVNDMKLIMVPLNVGKLLLPKVIIKCLSSDTGKDFSMDVDVKNGLETLLVVPDLDSITFSF